MSWLSGWIQSSTSDFQKSLKCFQTSKNAGKLHFESTKFQIFLGEHSPHPHPIIKLTQVTHVNSWIHPWICCWVLNMYRGHTTCFTSYATVTTNWVLGLLYTKQFEPQTSCIPVTCNNAVLSAIQRTFCSIKIPQHVISIISVTQFDSN